MERYTLDETRGDISYEVDGDLLMIATIQSAQGVTALLKRILNEAVSC